jgi:hypothetical protein
MLSRQKVVALNPPSPAVAFFITKNSIKVFTSVVVQTAFPDSGRVGGSVEWEAQCPGVYSLLSMPLMLVLQR